MVAQDVGLDHVARLHPTEAIGERDPGAGDRGGARSAIGLEHVAIDRDLALAERFQVDGGAQRAADQALDFDGAAVLLSGGGLAAGALQRCARQHAVFGRHPAAALALEPGRQPLLERRGHQHMRVAEFNEAGTFGIFDDTAFQRYGAQFIRRSAAWPHAKSPKLTNQGLLRVRLLVGGGAASGKLFLMPAWRGRIVDAPKNEVRLSRKADAVLLLRGFLLLADLPSQRVLTLASP